MATNNLTTLFNIVKATNWSHSKSSSVTFGEGSNINIGDKGSGSFGKSFNFSGSISSSDTIGGSTSKGQTNHIQTRPLLYVDDILRMGGDDQIIIKRGMPICIEKKIEYWEDGLFNQEALPNPYLNYEDWCVAFYEIEPEEDDDIEENISSKLTEKVKKRITLDDIAIKVFNMTKKMLKDLWSFLSALKRKKVKGQSSEEELNFPGARFYRK